MFNNWVTHDPVCRGHKSDVESDQYTGRQNAVQTDRLHMAKTVSTLITSAKANAPVMMEENCSERGFSSAAKELGVKPKRMN